MTKIFDHNIMDNNDPVYVISLFVDKQSRKSLIYSTDSNVVFTLDLMTNLLTGDYTHKVYTH